MVIIMLMSMMVMMMTLMMIMMMRIVKDLEDLKMEVHTVHTPPRGFSPTGPPPLIRHRQHITPRRIEFEDNEFDNNIQ